MDEVKALQLKIEDTLKIAEDGATDGGHHKMWVIDQMVRSLTGAKYDDWVKQFEDGDEGPETYAWDVGVAP